MKLKADRLEIPLNEQETQVLEELKHSPGFRILTKFLKNKFNRDYKKLRNTKRTNESYERINGFLDGIEYVIKLEIH